MADVVENTSNNLDAEQELLKIINKYNLSKECENEIRVLILACCLVTSSTASKLTIQKVKNEAKNIGLTVGLLVVVIALIILTLLKIF